MTTQEKVIAGLKALCAEHKVSIVAAVGPIAIRQSIGSGSPTMEVEFGGIDSRGELIQMTRTAEQVERLVEFADGVRSARGWTD